jgi:hypothetical protein
VGSTIKTSAIAHVGTPGVYWATMPAPAIASMPTTITQKYQYNHPMENPAQSPRAILE